MRVLIAVAVAAGFVMPRPADACDCPRPPSTQDSFAKAEVVAVVKVTNVVEETRSGSNWVGSGPTHYTLTVERAWNGAQAGAVIKIDREPGRSTCDYELEPNTSHLLYLDRYNNVLDASAPHCTRNQPVDKAAAEIAALDQLAGKAPAASGATAGSAAVGAPAASTEPIPAAKKSRGCGGCATSEPNDALVLAIALVMVWSAARPRRRRRRV